jgi:hypothetical protein
MTEAHDVYASRAFGEVTPAEGSLSREEVDALLREPLVAALATTDDDGYPYQVPIWIGWDGTDIWLITRGKSAFMAHIAARPRVSILRLEGLEGAPANTRVLLLGDAEVVAGPGPLVPGELMHEVALRLAVHYQGAEIAAGYIERTRGWARYLVRIHPVRIVSWSHHDWHPKYRTP